MHDCPLVSIIINNYNYGRFLRNAIDSALDQTYPNVEVIVVDDGSTDDSRDVIFNYGYRVTKILKENGGQTSAFNAGFSASHGSIVCFLDADDFLALTALEHIVPAFTDPSVMKVHWPLDEVDAHGRELGRLRPSSPLAFGDLRESVILNGPDSHVHPPQSGNAWCRSFLERVLPLPEMEKKLKVGSASADACLSTLTPLYGRIEALNTPQGYYRIHGQNDYAIQAMSQRLVRDLTMYDHRCKMLSVHCLRVGIHVDIEHWKKRSWWHLLNNALKDIERLIGCKENFVLIDEDQWAIDQSINLHTIPFMEHNGQYWGRPSDSTVAIDELSRLRIGGATFVVIAWPAFWWLDYYRSFHQYLRSTFRCVLENDRVIIFDMTDDLSSTFATTREMS